MSCSEPIDLEALEQLAPPPTPAELGDAIGQAEALIAAARAEADGLRAQAVADGRRAGFEQGRIEATVALEPALAALADATGQVAALQAGAADRAEAQAVELALRLAEKIVCGALDAQPDRVLDVVRGALRGVVDGGRIVVSVHPDDVELVREAVEGHGSLGQIEVHEERRVARGGALVRTASGETDATLTAKLDRARELVAQELAA